MRTGIAIFSFDKVKFLKHLMRIQILYIIEEFLYIIEKICTLHYLAQTGIGPLANVSLPVCVKPICIYLTVAILELWDPHLGTHSGEMGQRDPWCGRPY